VNRDQLDQDLEGVSASEAVGRILRKFWQPVARVVDITPQRVHHQRILGEDLVLFRDHSGAIAVLADRCPHRGVRLSVGEHVDGQVQCLYHGWRFDEAGRCTSAPDEKELFSQKVSVRAYLSREYLGLVFVWLGLGDPSEFQSHLEFEGADTHFAYIPDTWPCSFYLRLENTCDFSHIRWAHRGSGLSKHVPPNEGPEIEPTNDGFVMQLANGIAKAAPKVRFVFPNILKYEQPLDDTMGWLPHVTYRVPVDGHACISFVVAAIPQTALKLPVVGAASKPSVRGAQSEICRIGEDVLNGVRALSELNGHPHLTEIEDYVCCVGQGRAIDRPKYILGRQDKGIGMLRALWADAIGIERDRARGNKLDGVTGDA